MHESQEGTYISEGQAKVFFPGVKDVFYNPVQEFNRDLSISVLRIFAQKHIKDQEKTSDEDNENKFPKPGESYSNGIDILEALAASGLRSIRYAKEIGGLKSITANDISIAATQSIKSNVESNAVEKLVNPNQGDACAVMYEHRHKNKFHCVDIDPYGSPSPFIDAAVQSVSDGGLLMITATDMAILCGNLPESCFAKYGSLSLKNKACHEMALRILLQSIQSSAARYGRYIHPLISVSVDFYVRLFMLVFSGKKEAKSTASKLSMVYQCVNCHTLSWQPLMTTDGANKFIRGGGPPTSSSCQFCRSRQNLGGPIWSAPIHDPEFVASLLDSLDDDSLGSLKTEKRIRGILSVIHEELPDIPLFYGYDRMASFLKLSCPSLIEFRSAILNAGYRVSLSHCYKHSVKTDAPPAILWDILLTIARKVLPKKTWPHSLPEKPLPSDYLLSREISTEVNLEQHIDANPESRKQKLVRFQANPEKHWGPKARAKPSNSAKTVAVKDNDEPSSNKKRKV